MISAGDLNKRLSLQTKTITTNAVGEEEEAWTTLATVWAGQKLLTVKDVNRQQGQKDQAEIKFIIRYRKDVTTAMRVLYRDQTYYITGTEETLDPDGLLIFVRKS